MADAHLLGADQDEGDRLEGEEADTERQIQVERGPVRRGVRHGVDPGNPRQASQLVKEPCRVLEEDEHRGVEGHRDRHGATVRSSLSLGSNDCPAEEVVRCDGAQEQDHHRPLAPGVEVQARQQHPCVSPAPRKYEVHEHDDREE